MPVRLTAAKKRFRNMVHSMGDRMLNTLAKVVHEERQRRGLLLDDMPLSVLQSKVTTFYMQGPEDR